MKEVKRKINGSQTEVKDDLNQYYVKSGAKLRNKNKFEPISLFGLIIISMLLGTAGAGKISSEDNNDMYRKDSSWPNTKIDTKKHEDLIIDAYNCLEDSQPSTLLSLKAPKKCEVTDGSAYSQDQLTNAQVLERLKLVPVNLTLCTVHFYVSVGWCGGEYALENFKHADIQTLRTQILVSERDCHKAQLDGLLKVSTPEYGSIQELDIMLDLKGGKSQSMFQPIGVSRPDSWCKGAVFYPPVNDDKSIVYLDYQSHFERKKMWRTDRIRRAVVTYEIEADVEKVEAFITSSGNKLIIPNKIEINRRRNFRRERLVDRASYRNIGLENDVNFLESYQDLAFGTVVFNISGLPRNECEAIRSVNRISQGELMKSKLKNFSILKYSQGEENTAVTLNKKIRICGREMYETKIKDIFVVILKDNEEYLENKKLKIAEFDKDVIYSAEIRAALNSVELSTDSLYTDINLRICLHCLLV